MQKKFLFILIFALLSGELLSACGQTGALYLPAETSQPTR